MVSPDRRREIERLFEAALERGPEEREAFLAAACGGDLALHQEVADLLSAHELPDGILERNPLTAVDQSRGVGPGDTVGPYRIVEEIGRGGMAVVYLAEEPAGRRVAVKLLHPGLTALLGGERFRREIRMVARLQHPGILPLYESGEGAQGLWYSMPYVPGGTLRRRLARHGALPAEEAVRIAREVAAALEYAHRRGVIHRDIKPENLLLEEDGAVRVGDFGIGRVLDTSGLEETLTRTGVLIGTPAYVSPEQARGERGLDGRADVYGLGCVLYEMLAGTPPYPAKTPLAAITRHIQDPVPSLLDQVPDLPPELDRVVRRALAKSPGQRYSGASALSRALGSALDPEGARPWWRRWTR